jgi:hypothetical protein
MIKRYEYKIYSDTAQYITTWTDVAVEPLFNTVINGGFVELQLTLARKTTAFGEEADIKFNNEVQLWCFSNNYPNGQKIFAGYISMYEPTSDGVNESVIVHCLGYHTRLTDFILEDGQGNTTITYSGVDTGKIAEDMINNMRRLGLPINWTETTLQKSGNAISYDFQVSTGTEILDKLLSLSDANWYWYVDQDKNLNFHPKNELPIHTFSIGKEISYIQPQKRTENVINRVYLIGGVPTGSSLALYSRYDDPASQAMYGLKSVKKTDHRIKDQNTLDSFGSTILTLLSQIEIRTTLRITSDDYDPVNGYNIEKIKIGDTCQIRNYQDSFNSSKWDVMLWDTDFWDFNVRNLTETVMQIVEIHYQPNYAELIISSKLPNTSKTVTEVGKTLVDYIIQDVPSSPAEGTITN